MEARDPSVSTPPMRRGPRLPRVAAIVTTRGRNKLLAETLESLLSQTVSVNEIIVVDDGIAEETAKIVGRFGARVRYMRKPPGEALAAINRGLAIATSDFIWIVEDTDIAPIDALANLLAGFDGRDALGMVYGRAIECRVTAGHRSERRVRSAAYPPEDGRSAFLRLMEDRYIPSLGCVLARRRCYDAIYPLRALVPLSIDYDIVLRLSRTSMTRRIPDVTLLHRKIADGPDNSSASDTRLIAEVLPTVSLGELIGRGRDEPPRTPVELRQALFQKAAIAGRKKLWAMSIDAIRRGVAADPVSPLSAMDVKILTGLLGCRHGLDELARTPRVLDHVRGAFAELYPRGAARRAVARALLIRLRRKPFHAGYWSMYWRLSGLTGGLTGIALCLQGGGRNVPQPRGHEPMPAAFELPRPA